jgi:hypothetical protein
MSSACGSTVIAKAKTFVLKFCVCVNPSWPLIHVVLRPSESSAQNFRHWCNSIMPLFAFYDILQSFSRYLMTCERQWPILVFPTRMRPVLSTLGKRLISRLAITEHSPKFCFFHGETCTNTATNMLAVASRGFKPSFFEVASAD